MYLKSALVLRSLHPYSSAPIIHSLVSQPSSLDVSIYHLLASPKLRIIMHQPRHDEDYLPIDDESDSTSDSDTDSLFDSSDNEADTASDTDLDSPLEEVDSSTDDDDDLFDDEVRHPPKYYLAAAANLDVGRLRQKRYSP
jgi:hypothetical protein